MPSVERSQVGCATTPCVTPTLIVTAACRPAVSQSRHTGILYGPMRDGCCRVHCAPLSDGCRPWAASCSCRASDTLARFGIHTQWPTHHRPTGLSDPILDYNQRMRPANIAEM